MDPSDSTGASKHAHHDLSKISCLCRRMDFFLQGNNKKSSRKIIFVDTVDNIAVDEDEGSNEEVGVPLLLMDDGGDDSDLDEGITQQ